MGWAPWRREAIRQSMAIIAISMLAAIATNFLRADRMQWPGEPVTKTAAVDSRQTANVIGVADAERIHAQQIAVYIDARGEKYYAHGHIPGAVNAPWPGGLESLARIVGRILPGKMIVVYCEGRACSASRDLASRLSDMGVGNVFVFADGWSAWENAGLPVEKGAR